MDCLTYNAAFELYEAGATVEMSLSTFSLIPVDLIADVPDTQSLFVSTSIPLSQKYIMPDSTMSMVLSEYPPVSASIGSTEAHVTLTPYDLWSLNTTTTWLYSLIQLMTPVSSPPITTAF